MFRQSFSLLPGLLLFATALLSGCSRDESPRTVGLKVNNVTASAGAQPIANTLAFGPDFKPVPQVELLAPADGKIFVLFALEVTNLGADTLTLEGFKVEVRVGGLFGGSRASLYYLLRGTGEFSAYMPIGEDLGVKPKDEIEPGQTITWPLMTLVDEGVKEVTVQYPGADPVLVRFGDR
jgi:hypothetical protein